MPAKKNRVDVVFVQLCGGEPALYDKSKSDGDIEAASLRISSALRDRGADPLDPERVKQEFDRLKALYETEVKNRSRGLYSNLNWFYAMDIYMRPLLRRPSGSSVSENDSDPQPTTNKNNGKENDISGQEAADSASKRGFETTVKENHTVPGKITIINEIPDRTDIGTTSKVKVTARKSFSTPTKYSPMKPSAIARKKGSFTFTEMGTTSSTLASNNPEEGKSTSTAAVENEPPIEDDTPCDVCRSVWPEEGNEMLFCERCDVCVHQACYGVPKVPEGEWLCSPCSLNIKPPCVLCPKEGGAMKRTSDERQWAHVNCGWWIKEVKFDIPKTMDGINLSKIHEAQWKLQCSLCPKKHGVCIQCTVKRCLVAYHVTCALDNGLTMDTRDSQENDNNVKWVHYCKKHSGMKTPHLKKKRKQKRKTRIPSGDAKTSATRRMSSSSHEDNINEASTSLVPNHGLSETGNTSESSSLDSGSELSTMQSSEESDEEPPAKKAKRSEPCDEQLRANATPCKNQSNHETSFQTPRCEVQNKDIIGAINKTLGKNRRPSSNSSSPQTKQQTLHDIPGFLFTKKEPVTPPKQTSNSCTTKTEPVTPQKQTSISCTASLNATSSDKTTKCSTPKKKPSSVHRKNCQRPIENNGSTSIHSSAAFSKSGLPFRHSFVEESSAVQHDHASENQSFVEESSAGQHDHTSENQSFRKESSAVQYEQSTSPQSHLQEAQEDFDLPSTEPATESVHLSTDQLPSSSSDHESEGGSAATTINRSKEDIIEQLTKCISVSVRNRSYKEAMKLERRIVSLCTRMYKVKRKDM